jgi:hypothetical protein
MYYFSAHAPAFCIGAVSSPQIPFLHLDSKAPRRIHVVPQSQALTDLKLGRVT